MALSRQQHVLIIGAGLTGLAMAQSLKSRNISFSIFEAEVRDARRRREWTMGLHWGLPILDSLLPEHLRNRILEASVDPSIDYGKYPNNAPVIYDGISGERMKELTVKNEDGSEGREMRVSRKKLRALCAEGIDVQYEHVLSSIEENPADGTVTASFTNGTSATGTLLIGADSSRSFVRTYLYPDVDVIPTPMDVTQLNMTVSYNNAEKALFVRQAHPVFSLMTHPDIYALISIYEVPDPAEPETWKFQLIIGWMGAPDTSLSNAERHAELKKRASGLAEPFRSAIMWTPDDLEIDFNHLGYWIAEKPWDTHDGRVTLAGDAAHAMPPHRGQGLNNALLDAWNLVQAIDKIASGGADQASEIQTVSDEIAERGAKEVRLSIETAMQSINYYTIKSSALFKQGLARG